jgi:hypothetical protein
MVGANVFARQIGQATYFIRDVRDLGSTGVTHGIFIVQFLQVLECPHSMTWMFWLVSGAQQTAHSLGGLSHVVSAFQKSGFLSSDSQNGL